MQRNARIRQVERYIGRRKLVWLGTRGDDAQPLLQLSQFQEIYSIIAPLNAFSMSRECCLEMLRGRRVDLNTYDLDKDRSSEAMSLRTALHASLREPSVLATYRPLAFLSAVLFPRRDSVEYLGVFHERQAPFEHKPWVESELRKAGVDVIPWRYCLDDDLSTLRDMASGGPIVLRASRSDGGARIVAIRDLEDLEAMTPVHSDGFISVAPLLEPHVPLNVNACVFHDGTTSLHGLSVQLIGIDGCTNREFGYCGNDYAAATLLDGSHVEQIDTMARRCGSWLSRQGYVGAFGVDLVLHKDKLLLAEVNPRFQGSSRLSAELDSEQERSDVFLEHLAAMIGLPPMPSYPLREMLATQSPRSQVIVHNVRGVPLERRHDLASSLGASMRPEIVPDAAVCVEPEGILVRLGLGTPVTQNGRTLERELARVVRRCSTCFEPSAGVLATQSEPAVGASSGLVKELKEPGLVWVGVAEPGLS